MKEILKKFKLILGSSSPRRKLILEEAGIPFSVKVIPIHEVYPAEMDPTKVPGFLAKKKAEVHTNLKSDEILLTADSVVISGIKILEKPSNYDEAFNMISILSGNKHEVITSFCLRNLDDYVIESESSSVWFNKMSKDEIDYYISTFEPYDKAGGYGIQEWIGQTVVSRIEGSYLNIVGLPMEAVYTGLKKMVNELILNK